MNFQNNSPEVEKGNEIASARIHEVDEALASLRMIELIRLSEQQARESLASLSQPIPEINLSGVRKDVAAEAPSKDNILELREQQTPADIQDIQAYIQRLTS